MGVGGQRARRRIARERDASVSIIAANLGEAHRAVLPSSYRDPLDRWDEEFRANPGLLGDASPLLENPPLSLKVYVVAVVRTLERAFPSGGVSSSLQRLVSALENGSAPVLSDPLGWHTIEIGVEHSRPLWVLAATATAIATAWVVQDVERLTPILSR